MPHPLMGTFPCDIFRVSGMVDVAHNVPQQITAIGKEASCRFGLDTRPDLLEGPLSVSGSA